MSSPQGNRPQRAAPAARSRMRRVNESVKEVLAAQLVDLKDPRIGFVTVTDVRTTPDLRQAEVFYTVLPDDEATREDTAAGLESAAPMLRRELGTRLRMKHIPDLEFTHDPVPEHGRRIESILKQGAAPEEPVEDQDERGGRSDGDR